MVEWLRPVVAAISVRDGWPARRTAEITIARLRRRRSSWRIPTDICFLPASSRLMIVKAFDGTSQILADAGSPVIVYCGPRKNSARPSESIRIDVDSALSLNQYFFE